LPQENTGASNQGGDKTIVPNLVILKMPNCSGCGGEPAAGEQSLCSGAAFQCSARGRNVSEGRRMDPSSRRTSVPIFVVLCCWFGAREVAWHGFQCGRSFLW